MTITAGAHSIQPSRRSARAPSDSGALRLPDASCVASEPAATCALRLIGVFLPSLLARRPLRDGSRDQPLGLQGAIELADHRLLGGRRADALRRRDQVR